MIFHASALSSYSAKVRIVLCVMFASLATTIWLGRGRER